LAHTSFREYRALVFFPKILAPKDFGVTEWIPKFRLHDFGVENWKKYSHCNQISINYGELKFSLDIQKYFPKNAWHNQFPSR